MTMPPPPGQGGFPPGYGNQPDPGYQNSPGYPGGYSQYPGGPPGGGPGYPGGPTYGGGGYGGGYPGPPGPPTGGGRGPLIMTVIGALVVVGGVVAALVFLLGDDKDSKDDAKKSGSPSMSTSATASRSSSSSPTPTDTATTRSATPTRTPTTGRPTATGTGGTSVESVQLNVGECINLDTITGNIDKVSCTTPHDMQVLKNFQMPGSVYPSDSDFQDEVSTQCDSVLTSTVSREPNPSKYTLKFSYPQEPSWDRGDREVTCLVQDASEAKISKKLG